MLNEVKESILNAYEDKTGFKRGYKGSGTITKPTLKRTTLVFVILWNTQKTEQWMRKCENCLICKGITEIKKIILWHENCKNITNGGN